MTDGTATGEVVSPRDTSRARIPPNRATAIVQVAPVAFAVVAEAAWISVAMGLVQEYALAENVLALPAIVAIVAAGAVLGRLVAPVAGDRWPLLAAILTIVAGGIGWLLAPEVRSAIADGEIARAFGANPGGWLAGVAVLRGFRHSRLPLNEPTLAAMLGLGIPGIAMAAIAGGMVVEPFRGRFLADALVAATIFVACATIALALARLTDVGADSGFDWRRNPPWLALVGVLVVAVAIVAQPVSAVAGPLIPVVLGVVAVPFLLVGSVIGFTKRTAWFTLVAAAVAIVGVRLWALLGGGSASQEAARGVDGGGSAVSAPPDNEVLVGAALILLAAGVAITILVRLWMSRTRVADEEPAESRTIDHGESTARQPVRRWRLGRRTAPTDAVSAYRALDENLRADARLRRLPGETPAEHARRLRAVGLSGLPLDLLAADYALARFGGVALSATENRRAVERWRSLRRELRARAGRRRDQKSV